MSGRPRQFPHNKKWSRAVITARLRSLRQTSADLSMSGVKAQSPTLAGAIVHYFGNHRKALKAAGIKPEKFEKSHYWSKAEILAQLRQRHQQGKELSFTALTQEDERLYNQCRRKFGSLGAALAKLGIDEASVRRVARWSKPVIIRELKRLHRAGHAMRYADLQQDHLDLLVAAKRHFGSWDKARVAAGIPKPPRKTPWRSRPMLWPADRVIACLRKWHQRGWPLTNKALRQKDKKLHAACTKRFGSVGKAIEAAGFHKPKRFGRDKPWTKQGVLEVLREHFRAGSPVSMATLREHHLLSLMKGARNFFGTVQAALEGAGLVYVAVPGHRPRQWSTAAVLAAIQDMHRRGAQMQASAIAKSHGGLYRAGLRVFGSHSQLLKAAGIPVPERITRQRLWTSERIVGVLQQEHAAGHDLRLSALSRAHAGIKAAIQRAFGGHAKALDAAGLRSPARKPLANLPWPLVIRQIQALAKAGKDLRYDAARRYHQALFHAARYYFGRWAEAIKRAGLDYRQVVKQAIARQGR